MKRRFQEDWDLETLVVRGGRPLIGRVRASGAKNAALPILAATLLSAEPVEVGDIPELDDIRTMIEVLRQLGATAEMKADGQLAVRASSLTNTEAPYDLIRRMRASFLVMGPLLARRGMARIALPGGCAIGSRPIDLHLKGLAALGVEVVMGYGFVEARTERLRGAEVYLDFPSVGATENLMMAGSLAEGTTHIGNAAREPEVVDLANFLNGMGAKVRGAGTDVIRIEGVRELSGTSYRVIPDRIEAGTYMMGVGIAGGDVTIENVVVRHLEPVIAKLRECGLSVEEEGEGLRVTTRGRPMASDIKTLPYPGFPTDLQPPWMALMTMCEGVSVITENVFEDRFRHVEELRRLGARIRVQGRTALVDGVARLSGAAVKATDLRAGAALILAGLAAEGTTEVSYVHHIDRGYVDIEDKLQALGADIQRQDVPLPETVTA